MKYLKKFEYIKENDFLRSDWPEKNWPLLLDIKHNAEDIFIDLKDDGFYIKVDRGSIIDLAEDGKHTTFSITINKLPDVFIFSDVIDCVDRLKDYTDSLVSPERLPNHHPVGNVFRTKVILNNYEEHRRFKAIYGGVVSDVMDWKDMQSRLGKEFGLATLCTRLVVYFTIDL